MSVWCSRRRGRCVPRACDGAAGIVNAACILVVAWLSGCCDRPPTTPATSQETAWRTLMRDPFLILEEEMDSLANHNMRYLHAARQHKDALVARLEQEGVADLVHLWQPATDVSSEMDVVARVGDTVEEKAAFLGCYYCLQFLRLNVGAIDSLRLNLISPVDKSATEREFMVQAGAAFRKLSGSYMRKLLEVFLEGKKVPRYAIIGVGTKADQDDIDVGVLDDGGTGRDALNDAVGRMSTEMLRYAVSLHFHISEHVGKRGYSAAIPEYREMLDKAIHDFVIISEMVGGALILGDAELFDEFKRSVVSRYYFRPGEDPKWHVGYLRGILGEIRSLIGRPLASERIHPKDDGLRMVKGVLSALKTIRGVDEVNAWRIIDALKREAPEDREVFATLERALDFLEIFRYVYQLVVAQEEEIHLTDEIMQSNIDNVAEILGYRHVGTVRPGLHLLVDYYEHLEDVRKVVTILTQQCTDHLKKTTVFADMFDPAYPGNTALDFAKRSRFFKGTTFWRDILEMLEHDNKRLLKRYMADLDALSPGVRKETVQALADCADYALGTVMAFLVILAGSPECAGCDALLDELHAALQKKLKSIPYAALKLIELFYRRPKLVNQYLMSVGAEEWGELSGLLETEIWDPEVAAWRDRLQRLATVHRCTSRYFRRYLERAGSSYPSCLTLLDNQRALRDISRGVLAGVEIAPDIAGKKERLGDFYDIEFMRIGLATLAGERASKTDEEFTEAADIYLQNLFGICRHEVDQIVRFRVATHDLLAIYATGGLGREQAYDDDFDLIMLLNTKSEEVRAYADKIAAKMNTEIMKRGTLPHYRFADHFGHYVTTLAELDDLLSKDRADDFIDRSQILEARMIVGTRRFAEEFRVRLIEPQVFGRRREYIRRMRQEIESRHADSGVGVSSDDVKEGIGGLRDIQMLLLMYKAAFRLSQPVNAKLLAAVSALDMEHRGELVFLSGALEFFKNLRDAYRMAVGAEDHLRPEYLPIVASAMGLVYEDDREARERLLSAYRGCTTQVAETVAALAGDLERSVTAYDPV